ncbi:MAG: AI-2E family transporter [Candidatus Eisenbacteria sp.]|nr:AI-2E family transporter [Candidatus Eisenbacteria bacterium]
MERRFPWLVYTGATLLMALALWSMRSILGPLVSTAALFMLLWPLRDQAAIRRLLLVVGLLLFIWILSEARAIVYPALAALALAFLLNPIVDRLDQLGVRRSIASLALIFPLIGLLLFLVLVLIPALLDQARTLLEQLPGAYRTVVDWVEPLLARLLRRDESLLLPRDLHDLLPSAERLLRGVTSGLAQVGRGLAGVFQIGAFLLLTPILTYYILVDFNRLQAGIRPYVPDAWASKLGLLGALFQQSVGAWLKGQLLVAMIMGAMTIGGFSLIGLPYALLLGCIAAVLNLVPILGFWVTFVVAMITALFTPAPLSMLLQTAAVLLIAQGLEQNLLSPKIVGRQLGVRPIILLLVMLGLSVFLGVLGVLLAAPVIGLARGVWVLLEVPVKSRSQATESNEAS